MTPLDSFPQQQKQLSALAFDYGTQRIGVAYGQSLTGTAQAVAVLRARDGVPDWNDVAALIDRWQPDVFVVGLPYNLDGSESPLMLRAMKFGHRLNGRFHKPSYGFDERLSSVEAAERIIDDADWESSRRLSSRRTSGHGAGQKTGDRRCRRADYSGELASRIREASAKRGPLTRALITRTSNED